MMTSKQITEKLKEVKDPELGIDIVSLGLIRDVTVYAEGEVQIVEVLMTLTTPLCPFANDIILAVEDAVEKAGAEPRVELSFDPPWEPTEELRLKMGV